MSTLSPTGTKLERISEKSLQDLLQRLQEITDDNDAVLSELFKEKDHDFVSTDLAQIVETTSSIRTKISMIEMIAPKLVDPVEMKEHFVNIFKFSEEKERVEKALKGRLTSIQNAVFLNRSNSVRRNSSTFTRGRGGRGSSTGMRSPTDQRFAKSADTAELTRTQSLKLSKAASMDSGDIKLEELVITSRKVQVDSVSRSDYMRMSTTSESPTGNPLHAHQMAYKAKEKIKLQQKAVLDNSRAFTAEKIDSIKTDTKQLGARRFSSIKDVVAMFDKTKSLMSVEEQYGISKEEQEKEEQELQEKLAQQAASYRQRSNSVTVEPPGEEVITITLDNDDEDPEVDESDGETPQEERKGLFGDDDEDITNDDGAGDDDFFAMLRKRQTRNVSQNDETSEIDKGSHDKSGVSSNNKEEKEEKEEVTKGENTSSAEPEQNPKRSESAKSIQSTKSRPKFEPNKDVTGYLLKKSPSIFVGWQIRWFKFLDNGDLIYLKKEDSIKAQGTIKLGSILPKRKILVDRQHRFDIHTTNRVYHLMATCSQDAMMWAEEITKRVKRINDHL